MAEREPDPRGPAVPPQPPPVIPPGGFAADDRDEGPRPYPPGSEPGHHAVAVP